MVYFEKSQPAPVSLASKKSYLESDVTERLCFDFKNKCYLCETKAPTSINVEHFHPHRGNKELMYDWNNLYFACPHCNNTKEMLERDKNFSEQGILDCTCEEDHVDRCISYHIDPFPKMKIILKNENDSIVIDNCRVENTIKLLNAIYNGYNTPLKGIEAYNIRIQLQKEIESFQNLIMVCQTAIGEEQNQIIDKIKKELQNDSAFTAFKRWIVWDNEELSALVDK